MFSKFALALTLVVVSSAAVNAETAREKQHRVYKADEEKMASEHQINMERKSGRLTRNEAIKLSAAAREKAKKAHSVN